MSLTIGIIFIVLLLFNSYQDFTSRSVYWINIPILIGAYGICVFLFNSYWPTFQEILLNTIIVSLQLLFVFVFFFIKNHNFHVINKQIGIADILFLALLIFVFSPVNLILFELFLFSISLGVSAVTSLLKDKESVNTIPLAGNLTLGLSFIFLLEFITDLQIRNQDSLNQLLINLHY